MSYIGLGYISHVIIYILNGEAPKILMVHIVSVLNLHIKWKRIVKREEGVLHI